MQLNKKDFVMKKMFYIACLFAFLGTPSVTRAAVAVEITETDYDSLKGNATVRLVSDGDGQAKIRVTNANGLTLLVYDVSGAPVKKVKVEGQDRVFELNLKKGCYIVKVGNVVRKISIG